MKSTIWSGTFWIAADGLSDRIDAEAREALTAALDCARDAVQA